MPRSQGRRKPPAAKKPPLTHFLCIPLGTADSKPQLEASIASFRKDVCQEEFNEGDSADGATRIHSKAIRPAGVLHCTLGVMSLDQERLNRAIELLKSLDITQLLLSNTANMPLGTIMDPRVTPTKPSANDNKPISPPAERESQSAIEPVKINLKGLVSMHDPQKTSIVYIEPHDPSERLYPLCLALQDIFKKENILVPDERELKLHATLVNTIYARGKKLQGHGPNATAPLKIDARPLLEKYEGFVWAKGMVLDRISICEMGAKKRIENGEVVSEEYTEVASVALLVDRE